MWENMWPKKAKYLSKATESFWSWGWTKPLVLVIGSLRKMIALPRDLRRARCQAVVEALGESLLGGKPFQRPRMADG